MAAIFVDAGLADKALFKHFAVFTESVKFLSWNFCSGLKSNPDSTKESNTDRFSFYQHYMSANVFQIENDLVACWLFVDRKIFKHFLSLF